MNALTLHRIKKNYLEQLQTSQVGEYFSLFIINKSISIPTKNACDTNELIFKFVHEFRTYSRKEKLFLLLTCTDISKNYLYHHNMLVILTNLLF